MKYRLYILSGIVALTGCTSGDSGTITDTNSLSTAQTAALSDQALAVAVCSGCHLFPEPQLLPKDIWQKGVLPRMAMRLGIQQSDISPYEELRMEEIGTVMEAGIFPERPLIDSVSWARINEYYLREAPDTAPPQERAIAVVPDLPSFDAVSLRFDPLLPPLTTLIRHDKATGDLWVGDSRGMVRRLDRSLRVIDSTAVGSAPADLVTGPGGENFMVLMGMMIPNDLAAGKLIRLGTTGKVAVQETVLQKLVRPVGVAVSDLDLDGRPDYVVCNHGNYTGSLSWYKSPAATGQAPAEQVLKAVPGTRQVIVRDLNRDQKPDLVALMGQGDEGIRMFENQGGGRFEEKLLLRFPSVYGSSYFQMADFNGDGFEDILYTNGDNADYSVSLKKYHGVRIFLNDGASVFRESWFYPLHGATQAEARDFDQDGDLDIAVISFFPDYNGAPEEGFVYFENTGNGQYTPRTFKNAAKGKWLVMETGDFDGDNDTDIALGSFTYGVVGASPALGWEWHQSGASVLILYNNLKRQLP